MHICDLWHLFGARNQLGRSLKFPVVIWHLKGLIHICDLWHLFGAHKRMGGESNSEVVGMGVIRV